MKEQIEAKRQAVSNRVHELTSRLPKAAEIYQSIDASPQVERVFHTVEGITGRTLRKFGFANEILFEKGQESLEAAKEHLAHGALILAFPFHRSIYDGLALQQIVEQGFTGNYDLQIMPFSYKFKQGTSIGGLPRRMAAPIRAGVAGFLRESHIKPAFVVQPKHYDDQHPSIQQIVELNNSSKTAICDALDSTRVIVPGYVTGTRTGNGQLERPESAWAIYLRRNPNVALLPVTHKFRRDGLRSSLHVNFGKLLTIADVKDFQKRYAWNPKFLQKMGWEGKTANFTLDDALMANISETTYLPVQKYLPYWTPEGKGYEIVDPHGIYVPGNYILK